MGKLELDAAAAGVSVALMVVHTGLFLVSDLFVVSVVCLLLSCLYGGLAGLIIWRLGRHNREGRERC